MKQAQPAAAIVKRQSSWHRRLVFLTLLWCLVPYASAQNEPLQPNRLQAGFSTDGSAKRLILEVIREARHSIHVMAYSFTSKEIALALVEAAGRGVNVQVVVDARQSNERYSAAHYLANHHLAVRADDRHRIQHHKVMIVDGELVQTGSFNFTDSAHARNAENVLVVRNAPDLAEQYLREWTLHWQHSTPITPRY